MRVRPWPLLSLRRLAGTASGINAPIAADVLVLIGYVLCRSTDARLPLSAWFVIALLVAVRWPASGLGIAVAVAVFPQELRAGLAPSVSLVAASGLGFALEHIARMRCPGQMSRPTGIVVAGVVGLFVATFLSMIHSLRALGPSFAVSATLRWTELAAGLAVLLLASRALALGSRRAFVLGMSGVVVALVIAVLDSVAPDLLRSSALSWALSPTETARATGPFASPNRLGTVAAAVAVAGACGLLVSSAARRWWSGLAALGTIALALSFSRGALLGFGAAVALILFVRRDRVPRTLARGLAVAAVISLPLLVMARLFVSGGTLGGILENDVGRLEAWLAGLRMIAAQPLFGHGFGAFAVRGAAYGATDGLATAHNEFIDLWAQAGILAAAAFLAIVGGVVIGALRRRDEALGLAALGAVVVFAVASSFNVQSPFLAVTGPVWLVAAFGIASRPLLVEPQPGGRLDAPP
jgi:O-antigen ligase